MSLTYTSVLNHFGETRAKTEKICQPLFIEDYSVQPTVDVSPPKWHLAHSTWFFEQFVLVPFSNNYELFNEDFAYLFNSYYNNAGERVLRPNRGLMTRPSVKEVYEYRTYVTKHIIALLEDDTSNEIMKLVEIGIHHEQQHQELLAYDIKYILGHQPSFPAYGSPFLLTQKNNPPKMLKITEGVYTIGHQSQSFSFDNELAVHKVYINDFVISDKLVTNGEYLAFMNAGGYQNFNLWHAEGWDFINKENITSPMYWYEVDGVWMHYDLSGLKPIDMDQPVAHISYYEAFAYAEWKEMRLPTEFEWEVASSEFDWGQLWEWTASAYLPYPGFKKVPGALGEYNGKFMVSQHVLRGASIATAAGHSRHTYRNFFHPSMRWLYNGIRLAK